MTITQGAWHFQDNTRYKTPWKTNPYSITCRKAGVHGSTIANIPNRKTISDEEKRANALLIAAAPDLLEALMTMPQGLVWSDDELWAWHEKACKAIDKATGGAA